MILKHNASGVNLHLDQHYNDYKKETNEQLTLHKVVMTDDSLAGDDVHVGVDCRRVGWVVDLRDTMEGGRELH